jgi:hypothetical protein
MAIIKAVLYGVLIQLATVQGAPQRRDVSRISLKMPQVAPKVVRIHMCMHVLLSITVYNQRPICLWYNVT